MSKKKAIDFDALEKEYTPSRIAWTKEELEIIKECAKRGFPARFVVAKNLLPGRTASSVEACLKRYRSEFHAGL